MAIKNRVPDLLAAKFGGKENINLKQVQREVGDIAYGTVNAWVKDKLDRVDFPTLEKWCRYLGVGVGDILVYMPDEQ